MQIIPTNHVTLFSKLDRNSAFSAFVQLFTRNDSEPKEYTFIKKGKNKATTTDGRTNVHFIGNEKINICHIRPSEKKKY